MTTAATSGSAADSNIEMTEQDVSEQYDPVESEETPQTSTEAGAEPGHEVEAEAEASPEPTAEAPAAEETPAEPATDVPVEEPVAEEPVAEEPVAEEPVAEEPRLPRSPRTTTRSRRSVASSRPRSATGSWCTPTPAWRTG